MRSKSRSIAHGRGRPSASERTTTAPLARYALVWIGAAAVAVVVALGAMRAFERRGDPTGTLPAPPTGVLAAARAAGCSFARIDGPAKLAPGSPPVVGEVHARPALDGAYSQAPSVGSLVAALARGRIVIQYRPRLTARERALLEQLYAADRRAIILTPDQTHMDGVVSASAWRRVLVCPRIDTRVLDALAEFRDRLRGRGAG